MLVMLPILSNSITSPQPTAPGPTVAVNPTATLRSPCNGQEGVATKVAGLLVSLVGTDVDILETRVALDDDRDGRQMIQIRFQAYKRGTGKYPKGDLYIDLDDITCEILAYELFW